MPPAPDLCRDVVIVAHGSPADPAPQEAALMALAVRVAMWLPGWRVRGCTLAAPGSVEAALRAVHDPVIYPFFMAEGFFTRSALPRRLAAAGQMGLTQHPAFGQDAGLADLILRLVLDQAAASGIRADATTLLIAAHGSQVSPASATITEAVAGQLRDRAVFARVVTGYVEEEPFLNTAAHNLGPAICLPFFALRAGHVLDDVPKALAEAGFTGPVLPPLGEAAAVARMIAESLARLDQAPGRNAAQIAGSVSIRPAPIRSRQ